MKKLKYTLNSGYDDWQAMLPTSFKNSTELAELLEDSSWSPGAWNGTETIPFILVGKRTWDLSTEEVEELGHDGFKQKYPYGKPLHQPGANGEEFREILDWGSLPNIEHEITQNPVNGGGNTYRIISSKLKDILEKFQLPPHRFYPIEVTHEITGEKRPYFLFHLTYETGDYVDNAYWPMMESKIIKKGSLDEEKGIQSEDKLWHTYDIGTFKTYKEFQEQFNLDSRKWANVSLTKELDLENDEDYEIWLKMAIYEAKNSHYVYEEPFDLIWMGTTMMISEDLKKALDENFPEQELYLEFPNIIDVVTDYQPGEELPF